MQRIYLFIALLAVLSTAAAQPLPPDTVWTRLLGSWEVGSAVSIDKCIDGGFIVAGITGIPPDINIADWAKTNSMGIIQWSGTYCPESYS